MALRLSTPGARKTTGRAEPYLAFPGPPQPYPVQEDKGPLSGPAMAQSCIGLWASSLGAHSAWHHYPPGKVITDCHQLCLTKQVCKPLRDGADENPPTTLQGACTHTHTHFDTWTNAQSPSRKVRPETLLALVFLSLVSQIPNPRALALPS